MEAKAKSSLMFRSFFHLFRFRFCLNLPVKFVTVFSLCCTCRQPIKCGQTIRLTHSTTGKGSFILMRKRHRFQMGSYGIHVEALFTRVANITFFVSGAFDLLTLRVKSTIGLP